MDKTTKKQISTRNKRRKQMYLTLPMIGVLMVFIGIFVAGKLAQIDSPVIDVLAWILGIALFAFIILSKLHF
jgi:cytochrome c oxidase assembly factor CtaG